MEDQQQEQQQQQLSSSAGWNTSTNWIHSNVSFTQQQHNALPAQMFFYPAAPILSPGSMEYLGDPNVSDFVNITRSFNRLTSPLAVTIAVLLVFLFSPIILIGNSLVLIAMYRFKRLRTPSNYLVMSLASSDLGIGMFMPVGMYLELGEAHRWYGDRVCLLSYGVAISLCSVSVLVMVAIAVDRFTSLARPLRYNNLITHTAVERYIAVFWAYASLVGFTPLGYSLVYGSARNGNVAVKYKYSGNNSQCRSGDRDTVGNWDYILRPVRDACVGGTHSRKMKISAM